MLSPCTRGAPEPILRRKMAFADAWWDGSATLGGVEARRVARDSELVSGLGGGMFIPLLGHPLEAVGRWPWDVVVDAREQPDRDRAPGELVIVLGPGAIAGADCDLVIEVGGLDPGAVVRAGAACGGPRVFSRHELAVRAPADGVFRSEKAIGERVREGEMIGLVGTALVLAPCDGRLRGLIRPPPGPCGPANRWPRWRRTRPRRSAASTVSIRSSPARWISPSNWSSPGPPRRNGARASAFAPTAATARETEAARPHRMGLGGSFAEPDHGGARPAAPRAM